MSLRLARAPWPWAPWFDLVELLREQVLHNVEPEPNSGCWLWLGARSPEGYGIITLVGYQVGAHRLSYALFCGVIEEGLRIDHLCRTPPCVNPRHLEPVTARENFLRADPSLLVACRRGHPWTAESSYVRPNGWRRCRTCERDTARLRAAGGTRLWTR